MDAVATTSEQSDSRRFSIADFALRYQRSLLALAFTLIILAGAATYITIFRLTDANRMVEHTLDVRQNARVLLSDLQDAETGQRGFLLTGDDRYLEPLNRVSGSITKQLNDLHRITADNKVQQDRLNALEPIIEAKLDELL